MTSKKKKTRLIFWVCDKEDCSGINTREIPLQTVINDDVCDTCKRHIHEPQTQVVKNDKGN